MMDDGCRRKAPSRSSSSSSSSSSSTTTTTRLRCRQCIAAASVYGDVFTKVGDGPAPMLASFPQAPTQPSKNCHIEIDAVGTTSSKIGHPVGAFGFDYHLTWMMAADAETLHVHDASTCLRSITHYAADWYRLRWCRVERCPNLHSVFHPGSFYHNYIGRLQTIWASDLLMARCVWSKPFYDGHFEGLQHLHLRRCPSLRFALAMGGRPSFPRLKTLHIIHCGDLRHIFVGGEDVQHTSVSLPKLTTIHLHDLPALQQICEGADHTPAPALKTIRIRGCWSLRRLPSLMGRKPGTMKPAVEVEKDVWDALEWDGMDAGHHPSLYEPPVHSRYYKQRCMLRGTVLR